MEEKFSGVISIFSIKIWKTSGSIQREDANFQADREYLLFFCDITVFYYYSSNKYPPAKSGVWTEPVKTDNRQIPPDVG